MLKQSDSEIFELIKKEADRQRDGLVLIPSENYTSAAVREALGSVFVNKYSEGYPGKRYYSGNQYADEVENLARARAKELFGVEYVNVQPYSGSPANQAVYFALTQVGETVMGMALTNGGHLTHGHGVNFSGKHYNSVQYTVDSQTGLIDFEKLEELAKEHKPKMIWTGATAYPRIFDWERLSKIADKTGSYLIADISHIAGLIVAGVHPSPVPFAHIVTTTTHKTLRGPRGAMIMVTKKGLEKDPELPVKIDKAVFPGLQGGPHDNQTAAIAVCLKEARGKEFKNYGEQIIKNAKVLAGELVKDGFDLVTNGTDNHLLLIDLTNKAIAGKEAQNVLEEVGIFVNKNTVPGEKRSPFDPSGIRLGTPAVTTRGMKEEEMVKIAGWINDSLKFTLRQKTCSEQADTSSKLQLIKEEIREMCRKFPVS
ncbi:MAG: serine hydroxymethyltransferase [bacterium]|nr:serine hydroxymethyltransferase [bacterium]